MECRRGGLCSCRGGMVIFSLKGRLGILVGWEAWRDGVLVLGF